MILGHIFVDCDLVALMRLVKSKHVVPPARQVQTHQRTPPRDPVPPVRYALQDKGQQGRKCEESMHERDRYWLSEREQDVSLLSEGSDWHVELVLCKAVAPLGEKGACWSYQKKWTQH